jgi:hypothetical protein
MPDKQATQTTKSSSEPWSKQIPFLEGGMNEAAKLYNSSGPTYAPFSTVQGFSPAQQQAQQMGMNRAQQGNPVMGASANYAQKSINGDFLNTGDQNGMIFQNMQSRIQPAIASQFSGSGRYGSQLHGDTFTRAMTEAYAPVMQQNYQQERGRQQDMAQYAPQYAADDYMNIAAMDAIGTQQQGLAQRERDDAVARYSYDQDKPYNKLAQYMGLIGGNYGGQTTSQQPYTQPGLFSSLLGGGLAGAGMAGNLGWRPFG